MVSLGIDGFFYLHTLLMLVILGVLWARHIWRGRAQGWELSDERLCRCRSCGTFFVTRRFEATARCPHCQELIRIRAKKSSRLLNL